MLGSPFLHVDETELNIQGYHQFVWVVTDGRDVIFKLTDTRETLLVRQILKDYKGVLVSDFYAGYDAVPCRQQKCLVHLIRDLNDDLWSNPYNLELESFVQACKDLFVPMLTAFGRYGAKLRHLAKFTSTVDQFYRGHIVGREYQSEVTQKYQKRFVRYKDDLFRFLAEDGIPWNNNMAERAIRHLAIQRKISGCFYKRVASQYLRMLGIAQTCRFQSKSFLRFLLSGEKSVEAYVDRKRKPHSKLADSVAALANPPAESRPQAASSV
ncbi:MAG: transposase [Phycisphaerales bacterium]|nr:transposase [Phycisphaerales bacterium]